MIKLNKKKIKIVMIMMMKKEMKFQNMMQIIHIKEN